MKRASGVRGMYHSYTRSLNRAVESFKKKKRNLRSKGAKKKGGKTPKQWSQERIKAEDHQRTISPIVA